MMRDEAGDCNQGSVVVILQQATNAKVSPDDDDKTRDEIEAQTKEHGHSTPWMAGAYAAAANVRTLVLTHFSSRYKGDVEESEESREIMRQIRDDAHAAMGGNGEVICARDFLTIDIPRNLPGRGR